MSLIAITGGIGSGKSVVSAMLKAMDYKVYDTDSRARKLMDESDVIKHRLTTEIDDRIVDTGVIDRALLSSIVFSDASKLAILNDIVHSAVREDLKAWQVFNEHNVNDHLFVECAILYESGLDRMVDVVWEVVAPRQVRLQRIIIRGVGMTPEAAEARIITQENFKPQKYHAFTERIVNDDTTPILPQLLRLLSQV